MLRLEPSGGAPIACVLNYAVHPVLTAAATWPSTATWPAAWRNPLAAALGGHVPSSSSTGAQGDVGPPPATHGQASEADRAPSGRPSPRWSRRRWRRRAVPARRACVFRARAPRATWGRRASSRDSSASPARVPWRPSPGRTSRARSRRSCGTSRATRQRAASGPSGSPRRRLGFTWGGDVGAEVNLRPSHAEPRARVRRVGLRARRGDRPAGASRCSGNPGRPSWSWAAPGGMPPRSAALDDPRRRADQRLLRVPHPGADLPPRRLRGPGDPLRAGHGRRATAPWTPRWKRRGPNPGSEPVNLRRLGPEGGAGTMHPSEVPQRIGVSAAARWTIRSRAVPTQPTRERL